MKRNIRVIAGPYGIARKYAKSMGWVGDDFLIVTRGHQLATLDPALVGSIVTVRLDTLGSRVGEEIREEIERLRALWPVPMTAAA